MVGAFDVSAEEAWLWPTSRRGYGNGRAAHLGHATVTRTGERGHGERQGDDRDASWHVLSNATHIPSIFPWSWRRKASVVRGAL